MTDVGGTEPVSSADRLWREVAAELRPVRSLARLDAHAKQVLGTVSVVGSLLTGLGLLAGERLEQSPVARGLAVGAVAAAVLAVVVAWWCQLLRINAGIAPGDLIEVREWFERQFRRAYGIWVAGVLILLAIVLAGAAAMAALIAGPPPV
jgi:hypothetical protein